MKRLALPVAAAVIALVLALYLRKRGAYEEPRAGSDKGSAPTATDTKSGPAEKEPDSSTTSAPKSAPPTALHGLRLLEPDVASKRGWFPKDKPGVGQQLGVETVLAKWRETKIDLNCCDQPLPEMLDGLRTKYGLETRLDPELDVDAHTVTFKVSELAADQAIDLMLKMADLAYGVDESGTFWVATKERVAELAPPPKPALPKPVEYTAGFVRSRFHPTKYETGAEKRAEWMKGRTVSVTIANKPVAEAMAELAEAGGLKIWSWSDAATAAAANAPIASLVGEGLSLDEAVDSLLRPAGLELDFWWHGEGSIRTKGEGDIMRDWEKQSAQFLEDEAKRLAELRDRVVKIEGKVLSLANVGAQLSAQVGYPVRIVGDLEFCAAAWESDGKEQKAGEVLDILAKDAPLMWGISQEIDPENLVAGTDELWLVPPK